MRSKDVMKPATHMSWSRFAVLAAVALAALQVAPILAVPARAQAVPETKPSPSMPAPSTAAAPASPHLQGVRAGLEGKGVTLTLDVAGDFTYVPGNSGAHLLTVDLPGVGSAEPSTSHLLESALVSSYRVVESQRDGKSNLRVEVLLKTAAAADYRRTEHGLEIRLTPTSSMPASTMAASPRPVSMGAPAAKANRLERVNLTRGADSASVEVEANGTVEFKAFELRSPHRLVVDLPDVVSQVGKQPITPAGAAPFHSVRVGQFRDNPPVARVVVDLDENAKYDVRRGARGLEIEVRSASAAIPATPAPSVAPPVVKKNDTVMAAATMPASSDAVFASVRQPAAAPAPVAPAPIVAAPISAPIVPAQQQVTLAAKPAASQANVLNTGMGAKHYTGEPISINVKGVDLADFFRLIQEISGLNVIVDSSVKGTLTMVLNDVPWDQALDIVNHNNQLDAVLVGNVLRIATIDTLKKEQESVSDLSASQRENVPQVTDLRPVNYAKAADLAAKLRVFLTKCSGKPGSTCKSNITSDDRTNQLIITDYADNFPELDKVLKQLDKRTQQVEIEARVVSASRQFTRELGSQLGLNFLAGTTLLGGNPVGGNNSPIIHTATPLYSTGGSIPLFSNFPAAGANTGVTITSQLLGKYDLDAIITAAEQKGTGKLLSRPKIITQNNVAGKVQQGVKIPIQTTVNNTVSLTFQDVTLSMVVTPQITSDGTIFLDIDVTNSTIDPGIPRINGTPALDTQEANTRVLVQDGGTVVFGGVIQNQNNLTIQQVPLLGSIPILGNLFKSTGVTTTTSELLFFVTPKII
jgi:type IV pilus assembly protein PilQ